MPLPLSSMALAAAVGAAAGPVAVDDGNAADQCQWPTVVSFRAGEQKCSGILVHPEVIVTAAHCIADSPAGGIRFGEGFQPAAVIVDAARCGIHPDYRDGGSPSNDLGWCVLSEPVPDVPLTPLVAGCELAWVHAGDPAVIVGFGVTQRDLDFGTKRYAFTVLDSDVRSDGTVWVGDAEVNGCRGDSGGPAFVQSPSGTWHALGVLAFGPECGRGPVLYRTLADRMAWLESETGFDLAPCHDATGAWDPGPDCGSIAADPRTTGRRWIERCVGDTVPAPRCPSAADATAEGPEPATDSEPGYGDAGASERAPPGCGCRASPPGATPWVLVLLALTVRPRRPRLRPAA